MPTCESRDITNKEIHEISDNESAIVLSIKGRNTTGSSDKTPYLELSSTLNLKLDLCISELMLFCTPRYAYNNLKCSIQNCSELWTP